MSPPSKSTTPATPRRSRHAVRFDYPGDHPEGGGALGFLAAACALLREVAKLPPGQFSERFPGANHAHIARELGRRLTDVARGDEDARVVFGQAERKRVGRPTTNRKVELAEAVLERVTGEITRAEAIRRVAEIRNVPIGTLEAYVKRYGKIYRWKQEVANDLSEMG